MRCVGWVRAFCVTAAVVLCGGSPSFADPVVSGIATDAPAESHLSGGGSPEKFLYFSGFDLWRSGGSFYGGMQWAPRGLNEDGFTLKLLLAEGTYRYFAGATNIRGTGLLASIMPGWRIKRGDFEARIFAGLDLQNHRTSPEDPGNSLRGNHAGLRVGADLWWERRPRSWWQHPSQAQPSARLSACAAPPDGVSWIASGPAPRSKPRATRSIASTGLAHTLRHSGQPLSNGRWVRAMSRTTAIAPGFTDGSAFSPGGKANALTPDARPSSAARSL
jgi:hypothetical protein